MANSNRNTLTKDQRRLAKIKEKLYRKIDVHQGLVSGSIIVMEDGHGRRRLPEREHLAEALRNSYFDLDLQIVKLLQFADKLTKKS